MMWNRLSKKEEWVSCKFSSFEDFYKTFFWCKIKLTNNLCIFATKSS